MTEKEKKPENPTAFPEVYTDFNGDANSTSGMTLRDYFAAKAMKGIINSTFSPQGFQNGTDESCARKAYEIADAMLKERMKP